MKWAGHISLLTHVTSHVTGIADCSQNMWAKGQSGIGHSPICHCSPTIVTHVLQEYMAWIYTLIQYVTAASNTWVSHAMGQHHPSTPTGISFHCWSISWYARSKIQSTLVSLGYVVWFILAVTESSTHRKWVTSYWSMWVNSELKPHSGLTGYYYDTALVSFHCWLT
jgi:hypothetical protein